APQAHRSRGETSGALLSSSPSPSSLGGLPRRAGELRGRQQIRPDRAGAAEDHDMGSLVLSISCPPVRRQIGQSFNPLLSASVVANVADLETDLRERLQTTLSDA